MFICFPAERGPSTRYILYIDDHRLHVTKWTKLFQNLVIETIYDTSCIAVYRRFPVTRKEITLINFHHSILKVHPVYPYPKRFSNLNFLSSSSFHPRWKRNKILLYSCKIYFNPWFEDPEIFFSSNYESCPGNRFLPSPCTYTGDKVVRHRCASLLQCRTTLALLRSALRRGRFIPEIYFLLKRPPKTVLSSRSDVPSRFLHGQVLRFKVPPSCSLKNEFAPGTKGGEGEVGEAKGKTTLEKRTIVLFYLNACMRRTR